MAIPIPVKVFILRRSLYWDGALDTSLSYFPLPTSGEHAGYIMVGKHELLFIQPSRNLSQNITAHKNLQHGKQT